MEIESLRTLVYMLSGTFGFVCTIWAICIPTVREVPNAGSSFYFIGWAALIAIVLVFMITMGWGLIEVNYGDAPPSSNPTFGESLLYVVIEAAFVCVGIGLLQTLRMLSKPR